MIITTGVKNRKAATGKANGHQSWPASSITSTSSVIEVAMTRVRIGISLSQHHTIIQPT